MTETRELPRQEEDLILTSLLERLADLTGAIANCDDTDSLEILGRLYTDTLDVIKDIKKQNQEVRLAEVKCAKDGKTGA